MEKEEQSRRAQMRTEPGKAPRSPAWCQTKANFPFKTFNWILFGNFRQTQYSELSRMLTILFFFSSRGAEKMWWCFHHIHSTAPPLWWLSSKESACRRQRHEMRARSLGREDPPEKERATHSSNLAWEILWTESLAVHGGAKGRPRPSA